MNPSTAQATEAVALLAAIDAAATANATGTAVEVTAYEGPMIVVQNVGIVDDGTITGKVQTGDLANGTDMEDLAGAAFVAVTPANDPNTQRLVIQANACKKYIRYLGTIVTGGALVSAELIATKKLT
jgi:hypothetical protein